MYSKLLRDHQIKQSSIRDENEKLRKKAIASVSVVSSGLMDSVNGGVVAVFSNQKKIEQEARSLQVHANRFSKQTTQWLSMIDNFNSALKELGDLENWAKTIEEDILQISSSLEYVYKNNNPNPPVLPSD
eukprot:TRINITY_DN1462_c0_g1_i1.p1 TRINITY_DN1462_c0_g1~~TRINITY_DN1462_c0_g1_i1.p1  ORF type:complete len:147 (-),score=58.85 TRINITY_DN1462_c0_g1_i1:83-472(-)